MPLVKEVHIGRKDWIMFDEYRVLKAITSLDDDNFIILKMIPNVYMTKQIPKQEVNAGTLLDFYHECLDKLAEQAAKDIIEIRDEMKGVNND